MPSLGKVRSVTCDGFNTFFQCDVYACGDNSDGQLGLGHSDNCNIPTKTANIVTF